MASVYSAGVLFDVIIGPFSSKPMDCYLENGFLVLNDEIKNERRYQLAELSYVNLESLGQERETLTMDVSGVRIVIFTEKYLFQLKEFHKKLLSFINSVTKKTIKDYNEISVIGCGATGNVILASDKLTNELFAIKIIPKSILRNEKYVIRALAERDALMKIQHPFVTQLFRTFQSKKCLYYVLEFIGGGDLCYHLNQGMCFNPEQVKLYACEIVIALLYIHGLGIIYRDLKPENILVGTDGHLKLADFGLAKEIHSIRCTSLCGTKEYLSPEIVSRNDYGMKSDWWAFGILLYRLLTNRMPFKSENTARLFEMIQRGRVRFPSDMDPDAKSLITMLLQTDPEKRIGDEDIKRHPYFNGIDWDKVYNKKYTPYFIPDMTVPESTENFPDELKGIVVDNLEREDSDYSIDDSDDDDFYRENIEKETKCICSAPLMYLNDFSCVNLYGLDTVD